jgi:pimeloyl-ACP methyl ester carboxylesterase
VCRILPRCRAVTIEEAGHVPQEEKPEEVISLINEFLPKVSTVDQIR